MRHILPWIAALALAAAPARAQWEIFSERIPADGSWATYRITRTKAGEAPSTSEVRIHSRDGTIVAGTPCVWLEISPVNWLGSRNQGRLSFLIPREMDPAKAGRLLFVAREILFTDPEKGPWHMTPEDVAWLADKVSLTSGSSSTPEGSDKALDAAGREHACTVSRLASQLAIDPPFAKRQVTDIAGKVWRDEGTPFGVVRAEWTETLRKGDQTRTETKLLQLVGHGRDADPPPPIDHGEGFSLWRLIRR